MHQTPIFYRLDDSGQPVPEPDTLKWARWFETAERHVALDEVGDIRISTVFLGSDHQYGNGPPVLWETMVFGEPTKRRYMSRAEALRGHAEVLAEVHKLRGLLGRGQAAGVNGDAADEQARDKDGPNLPRP